MASLNSQYHKIIVDLVRLGEGASRKRVVGMASNFIEMSGKSRANLFKAWNDLAEAGVIAKVDSSFLKQVKLLPHIQEGVVPLRGLPKSERWELTLQGSHLLDDLWPDIKQAPCAGNNLSAIRSFTMDDAAYCESVAQDLQVRGARIVTPPHRIAARVTHRWRAKVKLWRCVAEEDAARLFIPKVTERMNLIARRSQKQLPTLLSISLLRRLLEVGLVDVAQRHRASYSIGCRHWPDRVDSDTNCLSRMGLVKRKSGDYVLLTNAGADLVRNALLLAKSPFLLSISQLCVEAELISTSSEEVARQCESMVRNRNGVFGITGIESIGKWSRHWWECFDEGYRIRFWRLGVSPW